MNGAPDADTLNRAILALAAGEPEWVLVDKRVLGVLLGPLADLLVQVPYTQGDAIGSPDGPYIWDDDDLCD